MADTAAAPKRLADGSGSSIPERTKREKTASADPADARPISFADLRPEVIGQVARCLDPVQSQDVMNLLLCVGPDASRIVRKMYLTDNEQYIVLVERQFHTTGWKQMGRIEAWMEVNEKKWKRACLGKRAEENVHTMRITFRQSEEQLAYGILSPREVIVNLRYGEATKEPYFVTTVAENNPFISMLVSIGGEPVEENSSLVSVKQHIIRAFNETDGDLIELAFMHWIDHFFHLPKNMIKFGLLSALKHMVEKSVVDVNDRVPFCGDEISLLFCAALQKSTACFEYLLSHPELNPAQPPLASRPWTTFLTCFVLHDISRQYLDALVRDPRFDWKHQGA